MQVIFICPVCSEDLCLIGVEFWFGIGEDVLLKLRSTRHKWQMHLFDPSILHEKVVLYGRELSLRPNIIFLVWRILVHLLSA